MDPCAPCGLCCRSYLVPLFGHDLWWISSRRGLAPESFAFIAEQETPDPLGFRLRAGAGPTYGLALLKREPIVASQPCIFLVESPDGRSRCGIYEDRPATCRSYPMAKLGARVYQRERTLCPPDAWDPETIDAAPWLATLSRLRYRRDTYVEAVARWNAAVEASRPPDGLPARAFCNYLLALYQRLGDFEASLGTEEFAAIEASWASVAPRAPDSAAELIAERALEPEWVSHLRSVRAIIDEFFPGLPALPFQPLLVEAIEGGQ